MTLLNSLFQFVTSGAISGLPTIAVMAVPFILGLIIGFFVKRILKIAVIAIVLLLVVTYFGFFGLTFNELKNLVTQYGPIAEQYAVLLVGILPLSVGFIIGLILGFILG